MIRTCSACLKALAMSRFSKSQLRKRKRVSRCKDCVNKDVKKKLSQANGFSPQPPKLQGSKRKRSFDFMSEAKRRKEDNFSLPAKNVTRIKQLGDGNCLYRSLTHGLKRSNLTHVKLRQLLAKWVKNNARKEINGAKISNWIKWEKRCDVQKYCSLQETSSLSWGGQIELCAFSHLFSAEIDVFEFDSYKNNYIRVTSFPSPSQAAYKINLLYVNRNHYDALVINSIA